MRWSGEAAKLVGCSDVGGELGESWGEKVQSLHCNVVDITAEASLAMREHVVAVMRGAHLHRHGCAAWHYTYSAAALR